MDVPVGDVSITQGGTSFWWRGQGGREAPAAEQHRMRNIVDEPRAKSDENIVDEPRAKLSCLNGSPLCFGTWGNWKNMCLACRQDDSVFKRDPCLAKEMSEVDMLELNAPVHERTEQKQATKAKWDQMSAEEKAPFQEKEAESIRRRTSAIARRTRRRAATMLGTTRMIAASEDHQRSAPQRSRTAQPRT